jgi:hypothetical protein
LDREKMAKYLFYVRWPAPGSDWDRHAVKDSWYEDADALIKYLTE